MNSLSGKPGQNWLIKYKLYHIPFWFLYHYLWWVVAVANPIKAASSIFSYPYFFKYFFYVFFQAVAVYVNLYYLIPKLLEKNKFVPYVSSLLLVVICASLCIVCGYYTTAFLAHRTIADIFGNGACFFTFFSNALPSTVASTTLAMSIKLTKNWIQSRHRQQLLETEKLETELKFLKYQFNPHFLFNTINSIFFLIHKNPGKASDSLAKFSELLRHQLYECNDTQIPLSKEVAYLQNFIELEKLRQNKNIDVTVEMNQKNTEHLGIAPFILMNFVENAFKHVSKHADEPNWIKIKFSVNQQQLHFTVVNSASPGISTEDVINYGGIGLTNVQRRLHLLYPGLHTLEIQNNITTFEIKLALQLTEFVIAQTRQKQPAVEYAV
jgi:two-component system LytT family sensor kinase